MVLFDKKKPRKLPNMLTHSCPTSGFLKSDIDILEFNFRNKFLTSFNAVVTAFNILNRIPV